MLTHVLTRVAQETTKKEDHQKKRKSPEGKETTPKKKTTRLPGTDLNGGCSTTVQRDVVKVARCEKDTVSATWEEQGTIGVQIGGPLLEG